ncbi:sigma-70 family RNA polymerase sigma factor [Leptolyngbya sp. FACHB-541]|uniref:RNA polymerase sigma factor n=1 Tax=Leptolyngbya sp. FACHB-541 TaxID=2692810 RepID=UPI0016882D5E|nr:sigma-70 family RNA polymerase sigma factor [Leptolyngbya sp. FACHB-541]MBD2001409.1 sigma-70 family RNA polymerase sigma factor [Leptolyngbya sp. FACHB-541]
MGQKTSSAEVGGNSQSRQILHDAIQQDWQQLQGTIHIFVIKRCNKLNLAIEPQMIEAAARDILHETIETALKLANKFDSTRSPKPWVLGIAKNIVLNWGEQQLKERNNVTPIADLGKIRRRLQQSNTGFLSESEMFDLLDEAADRSKCDSSTLDDLLSLIEGDDREILRLFYGEDLQGKELAAELGTSTGAIHVRLSRARKKLHEALIRQKELGGGR